MVGRDWCAEDGCSSPFAAVVAVPSGGLVGLTDYLDPAPLRVGEMSVVGLARVRPGHVRYGYWKAEREVAVYAPWEVILRWRCRNGRMDPEGEG